MSDLARRGSLALVLGLAALACAERPSPPTLPGVSAGLQPALSYLGRGELAAGLAPDGVRLGGLSALVWDARRGLYHAVCDDIGDHGPPRLYRLRIDLSGGRPRPEVVSWHPLRDPNGHSYATYTADLEGLALLDDGSLLIASEGLTGRGVPPFLRRFTVDGDELARLDLPDRYRPDDQGRRGVRRSLGFESLTVSPDGTTAYLATEGALAQDGPEADLGVASLARILALATADGAVLGEYAYRVEALEQPPRPADGFRLAGLVELLALHDGRLLALERQFSRGAGFSLRLYLVSLDGATDVRRLDSLAGAGAASVKPVGKRLLMDLDRLGLALGNLEGLALGPRLADGRRSLLVVEDDNFQRGPSASFLLFALGPGIDPPP